MFYVADGEMTFHVGDRVFAVFPGQAVFVPRGVPHTAWVSGNRPMRGVLIISPGNAEHVFEPVPEPSPAA
jgi:mannose-6-phosphate isomerase-like protein (cupin superfamily)